VATVSTRKYKLLLQKHHGQNELHWEFGTKKNKEFLCQFMYKRTNKKGPDLLKYIIEDKLKSKRD